MRRRAEPAGYATWVLKRSRRSVIIPKAEPSVTMEAVTDRANMMLAYQRVVENKGAAGVDNLSTLDLKPWLKQHWQGVKV